MVKRETQTDRDEAAPRLLTEVELELMNLVWKLGEASVADVIGELPETRKLAYTSVSTILRILEKKDVLGSRKQGRGHVYFPKLSKAQYEGTSLRHLVDKVFDGTPASLVRRLLEEEAISSAELDSLQALLTEKRQKK